MGSIVAEIADKIAANAEALEIRGGTGADGGGTLTLSTSELTVVDGDKLGRIDFQAPLETGADALLVGASIYAEADDTFAADNNSTELVFATGASEAAAEKMRITSDGKVGIGTATPVTDLTVEGPITIKEQAAADADTAGYGQIWVDDAANSPLMYTNDAGADIGITTGSTLNAASLGGVLPSGVTGGSGLTALGTVATGNLSNTNIVYPAGHVIKITTHTATVDVEQSGSGYAQEADANDVTVTCTSGNKLHIWIVGGFGYAASAVGYFRHGLVIKESGESDVVFFGSYQYQRSSTNLYNDTQPSVMYVHTAITTSVTIKRAVETVSAGAISYWQAINGDGIQYKIMEEQV